MSAFILCYGRIWHNIPARESILSASAVSSGLLELALVSFSPPSRLGVVGSRRVFSVSHTRGNYRRRIDFIVLEVSGTANLVSGYSHVHR